MKIKILPPLFFVLVLATFAYSLGAGNLSCEVVNGACQAGSLDMLHLIHLQNSHAELSNQSGNNYDYSICCNATGIDVNLTNNCTGDLYNTKIINLWRETNSHVELGTFDNYENSVCLGGNFKPICRLETENCDEYDTCFANIHDTTNSHIANCSTPPPQSMEGVLCCKLMDGRPDSNINPIIYPSIITKRTQKTYCYGLTPIDIDNLTDELTINYTFYVNGVEQIKNERDNEIFSETNTVLIFHFNNESAYGENSTLVYDFSLNQNNGIVYGGAIWNSSGKLGEGAFQFDGVNDYMNSTVIEPKTSIVFWFKNMSNPWIHYANVSGVVYLNGVLNTTAINPPIFFDNNKVVIGKYDSSNYFNGTIDELSIWNISLSDAEIENMYHSGIHKGIYITNDSFNKSDNLTCTANIFDGNSYSPDYNTTITVQNAPPFAFAINITPNSIIKNGTLVCEGEYEEPDGDAVTEEYSFNNSDGVLIQEFSINNTFDCSAYSSCNHLINLSCLYRANDSEYGNILFTNFSIVNNTKPMAYNVGLSPLIAFTNDSLICSGNYFDLDDEVDVITEYFLFNKTGQIFGDWSTNNSFSCEISGCNKHDNVTCVYKVDDGFMNSTNITSNNLVFILNSPPNITSVEINNTSPNTNDTIRCDYFAYDTDAADSPVYTYAWYENDIMRPENTTALDLKTPGLDHEDKIVCEVTGDDSENITKMNSSPVIIQNSAPITINPSLNSSFGANTSSENLTCYGNPITDLDLDATKNIFNWKINDESILALNMPFEEKFAFIKDYSGLENNGTAFGATYNLTTGHDGFGAYEFDGSNDYLAIQNDESFNFQNTHNFSISFRIKTTSSQSMSLIDKNFWNGYSLNMNDDSSDCNNPGYISFYVASGFSDNACSDFALHDGEWHLVVGVYDSNNSEIRLYIDGALQTDKGIRRNDLNENQNLIIGKELTFNNSYFNGTLDDLKIWKRALTIQQILLLNQSFDNITSFKELKKGQNWSCEIIPTDALSEGLLYESNSVTILNSPPIALSANLTPLIAFTNSTLTCQGVGYDEDEEDVLNYYFIFNDSDNDVLQNSSANSTFDCKLPNCDKYDALTCTYYFDDSQINSTTNVTSNIVIIQNTPPEADLIFLNQSIYIKQNYSLRVTTSGAYDNDTDNYSLSCGWDSGATGLCNSTDDVSNGEIYCDFINPYLNGHYTIYCLLSDDENQSSVKSTNMEVIDENLIITNIGETGFNLTNNEYTAKRLVMLNISYYHAEVADFCQYRNDEDNWSEWQICVPQKYWILPENEGLHNVDVRINHTDTDSSTLVTLTDTITLDYNGTWLDMNPPKTFRVHDGGDYTNKNNTLNFSWDKPVDSESLILMSDFTYEYQIYDNSTMINLTNWTNTASVRYAFETNLSLIENHTYIIRINAVNKANLSTISESDGIITDFTPPIAYITNTNPSINDSSYWYNTNHFNVTWDGSDEISGLEGVSVLIKEYDGSDYNLSYPDELVDFTSKNISYNTLKEGRYGIHIRAVDRAGNWQLINMTNRTGILQIDLTPPTKPAVNNPRQYARSAIIEYSWSESIDALSGINNYTLELYEIGGVKNVSVTNETNYTFMAPTIIQTKNYYLIITAYDKAGNSIISSDPNATPVQITYARPDNDANIIDNPIIVVETSKKAYCTQNHTNKPFLYTNSDYHETQLELADQTYSIRILCEDEQSFFATEDLTFTVNKRSASTVSANIPNTIYQGQILKINMTTNVDESEAGINPQRFKLSLNGVENNDFTILDLENGSYSMILKPEISGDNIDISINIDGQTYASQLDIINSSLSVMINGSYASTPLKSLAYSKDSDSMIGVASSRPRTVSDTQLKIITDANSKAYIFITDNDAPIQKNDDLLAKKIFEKHTNNFGNMKTKPTIRTQLDYDLLNFLNSKYFAKGEYTLLIRNLGTDDKNKTILSIEIK